MKKSNLFSRLGRNALELILMGTMACGPGIDRVPQKKIPSKIENLQIIGDNLQAGDYFSLSGKITNPQNVSYSWVDVNTNIDSGKYRLSYTNPLTFFSGEKINLAGDNVDRVIIDKTTYQAVGPHININSQGEFLVDNLSYIDPGVHELAVGIYAGEDRVFQERVHVNIAPYSFAHFGDDDDNDSGDDDDDIIGCTSNNDCLPSNCSETYLDACTNTTRFIDYNGDGVRNNHIQSSSVPNTCDLATGICSNNPADCSYPQPASTCVINECGANCDDVSDCASQGVAYDISCNDCVCNWDYNGLCRNNADCDNGDPRYRNTCNNATGECLENLIFECYQDEQCNTNSCGPFVFENGCVGPAFVSYDGTQNPNGSVTVQDVCNNTCDMIGGNAGNCVACAPSCPNPDFTTTLSLACGAECLVATDCPSQAGYTSLCSNDGQCTYDLIGDCANDSQCQTGNNAIESYCQMDSNAFDIMQHPLYECINISALQTQTDAENYFQEGIQLSINGGVNPLSVLSDIYADVDLTGPGALVPIKKELGFFVGNVQQPLNQVYVDANFNGYPMPISNVSYFDNEDLNAINDFNSLVETFPNGYYPTSVVGVDSALLPTHRAVRDCGLAQGRYHQSRGVTDDRLRYCGD